jgi:flagellar protein FliO/FliZ
MNAPSLLGPVAAFVLILALIPAALWLLKRTPMGAAASNGPMRLVASLPLAPNQRLLTVEVGSGEDRRWLVLGVTPAGIHTLHTLPPQAEPVATAHAGLPRFADLLQRQRAAQAPQAGAPGGPDAR